MSCEDCFKGVLHEGIPQGSIKTIASIETYISLPAEGTFDPKTAVIFLGDVFGFYNNAKLLCDGLAENGYATYFPDYLNGDQIPSSYMNALGTFDVANWRINHTPEITRKSLDPLIHYLREQGVTKLGATSYCFGGRFIMELALENLIEVGCASHPSGIIVPDDLISLLQVSKVPLLINACEVDNTWPAESQTKALELLGSNQYLPGFKQPYFKGCKHGFGTRGDPKIEDEKRGKEGAFKEVVDWFRKYLV